MLGWDADVLEGEGGNSKLASLAVIMGPPKLKFASGVQSCVYVCVRTLYVFQVLLGNFQECCAWVMGDPQHSTWCYATSRRKNGSEKE